MKGSEKINMILEHFSISPTDLAKKLELKYVQNIYDIQNDKVDISKAMAKKIANKYHEVRFDWLITGEGSMLNAQENAPDDIIYPEKKQGKNLIPFYDDVITVGGTNEIQATTGGVTQATEYLDTGDWFRDATAAIRHYGESMVDYPTGCILALKEVRNRELIVPGRDYMIETSEYRVTKRVQKGKTEDYFTAYSTNTETYADGRLIHEPFDIPKSEITRISLVIGYVVKTNGGTMVFSNNDNR